MPYTVQYASSRGPRASRNAGGGALRCWCGLSLSRLYREPSTAYFLLLSTHRPRDKACVNLDSDVNLRMTDDMMRQQYFS